MPMPGTRESGVDAERVDAIAEQTFEPRVESVADARRFVSREIGALVDVTVATVLTSEIAANAVLHARTSFRVRVLGGSEAVRIEIVDHEPDLLLTRREPSENGGHGLYIVNKLADDWGVESRRDEKVVWFEVRHKDV
jgi:anti-sigma regulatory factor (Ser/Thr protein kinase)